MSEIHSTVEVKSATVQNKTPDSIVTGQCVDTGYHFRRRGYVMCLHTDPGDNISTISAANNGLYHYRLQFSSTQENIGMVSEGMGQVMLGHRVPGDKCRE